MPPSLGSPRPGVRQGAPGEPAGEGDAAKLARAAPPAPKGGPIQPGLPWAAPQVASPLALALAARESRAKEPGSLAVWGMGVEVRVKVKGSGRSFRVLPAAPGVLRPGQDLPPSPQLQQHPGPGKPKRWGTADSPHQEVRPLGWGQRKSRVGSGLWPWGEFQGSTLSPAVSPRGSGKGSRGAVSILQP